MPAVNVATSPSGLPDADMVRRPQSNTMLNWPAIAVGLRTYAWNMFPPDELGLDPSAVWFHTWKL